MKSLPINRLLLGGCLLLTNFTGYSQTAITKIYTDFNGFWSTDSVSRFPNKSHHLLAFRVGNTPNDSIFSTGVNDSLLRAKGINFTPVNYKAVPIRLGTRSGTSYYIGLGSNYNNVWQPPSPSPGYTVPNYQKPEYYLTDGIQGLDIGTALFNIPPGTGGVSYQIDQFSVSRIGDKIPDIVVTQTGSFTGADRFMFVDINGNTVGNELSSSFPGSLGVAHWAFYNTTNGYYTNPQPQGAGFIDNNRNPRDIRVLQWDLSAFGLNASNVGNVTHFIHRLGGESDPAFVAYNTSSFRALGDLSPGCASSVTPSVWLQSDLGITANGSQQITSWKNSGNNTNNGEQSNPAIAPVRQGASLHTNYRPYVHFSNGNIMHQLNTPFSTATGNFDMYVVSRATTATGYQKIVGFKKSGGSRNDYASLWLTPTGNLEFRDSTVQLLTSTLTPGTGNLGIWHISYTRGGNLSISLNGNTADVLPSVTLNLPTYHTEFGDNTSAFDLAEIICYNSNLSSGEKQRIQSYLSVKYGMQYTPDYLSGANNTIWKHNNGGFTYNTFGIGREDCIGFLQKQSHSVTATTQDIIHVGLDTIFPTNAENTASISDAHYIIWGDNNGSLTTLDQIRSTSHCLLAPQRKWRAQTTGNLANTLHTLVAIDASGVSGTGWVTPTNNPQDYFLLIDRNGNGVYNDAIDAAIPASAIQNGTLIFKNVLWDTDLSAADIFTIGYKIASPDAGNDQTQANPSFTMNASPAAGTWSVASTNPANATITIQNPTQPNTQVTVPNSTSAVLRWEPQGTGSFCYDEVALSNITPIPLPIHLEYFKAYLQAKQTVLLSWKTAFEENNKGFYIERSANGTGFETIGFVKGINAPSQYQYQDTKPLNGINYYRIKQVDFDEAAFAYSKIESVNTGNLAELTVVPNPVTGELTIKGLALQTPITIFNTMGQIMYQGAYAPQDISLWPGGLYWIRVVHNGLAESIQFVKQ